MDFIDGFVAAVPVANKDTYLAHAAKAAEMFREYGATRVVECWGDDVPEGALTSFRMAVKQAEDEVVVFSWVAWPSKEVRDAAWSQIMADTRMGDEMPFDGKRLIYGGFQTILDA